MSFARGIHFASHHWITTWLWRMIDPNKWVPQLPEADHGGELCRFGCWMATGAGEDQTITNACFHLGLGAPENGVYHQNSPVKKRTLMIKRKQGVPCLKTPSLLTVDTTILRLSSSIAACGPSQEFCHCRNPNVLLFPPRHWMNMRRTEKNQLNLYQLHPETERWQDFCIDRHQTRPAFQATWQILANVPFMSLFLGMDIWWYEMVWVWFEQESFEGNFELYHDGYGGACSGIELKTEQFE